MKNILTSVSRYSLMQLTVPSFNFAKSNDTIQGIGKKKKKRLRPGLIKSFSLNIVDYVQWL